MLAPRNKSVRAICPARLEGTRIGLTLFSNCTGEYETYRQAIVYGRAEAYIVPLSSQVDIIEVGCRIFTAHEIQPYLGANRHVDREG